MRDNYFIATKSGDFLNRNISSENSILDFKGADIISFYDVNLNKELGKIENIDLCIYENKQLMTLITIIETILINIINESFNDGKYEKKLIKLLIEAKLKDKATQKKIRCFFKVLGMNKSFLKSNKFELINLFNELNKKLILNIKNYITKNKEKIIYQYENTFLYEIFEKKIVNYNSFLNTSFFSSYEKEMKSEDKINYPKYLLEKNYENIEKMIFYKERERVKVFNLILNNIYEKYIYEKKYLDNDLSDFSFSTWNLNCLISFNLIFQFMKEFNYEQKEQEIKKIKGNHKEEKIILFLNQPVISITALFFIDVLYNYPDCRKICENKNLGSCKLEGFSGSGSRINKSQNPETERKYKNSIFDIVDIVSSLTMYEEESLYITNDKGINLFFNWYQIDFKKIEIKSKLENSLIKHIDKKQILEYQIKEKKFKLLSENNKLILELSLINDNKKLLKKLLDYYSIINIGNEDYFEIFYKEGDYSDLIENIRLFDKGLITIYTTNNNLSIDILLKKLLNNYIGFLNKKLAEKLIKYQDDYFKK